MSVDRVIAAGDLRLAKSLIELREREYERPTADTDPGSCRWCMEEAFGAAPCPYHGEAAQRGEEE